MTSRRVSFIAACLLVGTLVALAALIATATGTADRLGRPLGTDFASFWSAGRLALEGQAALAYDWAAHHAMQFKTHGTEGYFPWSYPPLLLMVMAGLATLPYVPALFLWQGTTLAAALAASWAILPERRALLIAAAFPGVFVCLGHGQTGFLTAALFAGALVALPRHEIVAGVLFGLMAYKPQLGLLIPFALMAGGHWRAIAAAAVTVLASVGVTLLLWGVPVWAAFFSALPQTGAIVLEANHFEKLQSAFAWMRLWGVAVPLAYTLQALVSAAVLIACVWIWRAEVAMRLKAAGLMIGALMATPYVVDYDFVVLGMAIAFLAAHGFAHGFTPWEKSLLALAFAMPLLARTAASLLHVPLGFLTLTALFALVVWRVRAELAGTGEMRPLAAV